MKLIILLASATLGIWIVQPVRAATTREVYNIAKSISTRIDVGQNGRSIGRGSGFLLKKQGNVYTLITSKHVTRCPDDSCTYTITTSDGRRYSIDRQSVKVASDLDLAAIEFTSPHNYPLAQLGNSTTVKPGDIIYTSGFPVEAAGFTFGGGDVLINAQRRLEGDRGGYSLVYNAYTNKGMSGGAVFDRQGRVIAVHGQGDRVTMGTFWHDPSDRFTRATPANSEYDGNKMGFNRGVSTQWLSTSNLIGQAGKSGIQPPQSADEFLILAMNLFIAPDSNNIKKDKQQALRYVNQSIQLQPNYAIAYFLRSMVNSQLGDWGSVSSDAMKTYRLNSALFMPSAYHTQPIPVDRLDRWLTERQNFNQANKSSVEAAAESQVQTRNRRQRRQSWLGATDQSAIQKLDRAIQLYPQDLSDFSAKLNLAILYIRRAQIQQRDPNRAAASMEDFKKAAEIYPLTDYAYSYFYRGYLRAAGGDRSGAMAYYRQAAKLAKIQGDSTTLQMADATIAPSSSSREGGVRLGGFRPDGIGSARSIKLSAKLQQIMNADRADILVRMADNIPNKNQDRKLAISYLQRAADLYKKDGNMAKYQDTIAKIRKYMDTAPSQ